MTFLHCVFFCHDFCHEAKIIFTWVDENRIFRSCFYPAHGCLYPAHGCLYPIIITLSFICSISVAQSQTLEEAVSVSLATHPKVQHVIKRVQTKKFNQKIARSGHLPTLDIMAGTGVQDLNNPTTRTEAPNTGKHLHRREASLVLRQVIFAGYATVYDVKKTAAETLSEQYRLLTTASEMAMEVIRAYLSVLQHEDTLKLARQNLDAHRDIHRIVIKRAEKGVQSVADLSQIKGRLARSESNLLAVEHNLNDARIHFFKLVGTEAHSLIRPEPSVALIPATLPEALTLASGHYPLLQSAQMDKKAALNDYEGSKSHFYPELSLEASRTWNDNLNGIKGRSDDLSVMFRVRYNLFHGGRDHARAGAALSRQEETEQVYQQALLQVKEETRLSWEAREKLQQQTPQLYDHLRFSKDTVNAYRRQFMLGDRILLDVLNAENETLNAALALYKARTNLIESEYRLLHISGNLLDALKFSLPNDWLGK